MEHFIAKLGKIGGKGQLGYGKVGSIPILGVTNTGPATHVAGSNERGTLQASASLLPSSNYQDFYPIVLSPNDDWEGLIGGTVIHVVNKTKG